MVLLFTRIPTRHNFKIDAIYTQQKKSLHWELLHMQFYNQKIIKKKKNLQDSDLGSFWK